MSTMDAINSNEDKYMIKVSEDDAINANMRCRERESTHRLSAEMAR